MAIQLCKQISCNSFKNKITYKFFSYKSYMYIHLDVWKQMTDAKLLLLHSNTWNHLTLYIQTVHSKKLFVLGRNTWSHLSKCIKKNELMFI